MYIQDITHVGTKLRNKFLKPSILLPLGNFVASSTHLRILIAEKEKEEHALTMTDLDNKDKMNFRAVENICSIRVTKILRTMPSTQRTVVFLEMTKDILDSFLHKNIAAIERIYLIWKSVFFLRIWRQWLLENGYTLQNFITSNVYLY